MGKIHICTDDYARRADDKLDRQKQRTEPKIHESLSVGQQEEDSFRFIYILYIEIYYIDIFYTVEYREKVDCTQLQKKSKEL